MLQWYIQEKFRLGPCQNFAYLRVHFLKLATPGMSFFNRATIKLTKAHYDNNDNMSLTHRATSEQAEVFLSTHRNSSWDTLRADPRVKRGT